MANLKTQTVTGDLGSQQFKQLLTSYNALLSVLSTYITGVSTAADTAAINALAVTAEAAMEANVYIQAEKPNVPASPVAPAV